LIPAICLTGLWPSTAAAFSLEPFHVRAAAGVGGPVGLIGHDGYWKPTTAPFTLRLAGQLRLPEYTPLALEVNAVVPYGLGMNLLFDVVQTDRIRVHLFDLGFFWNAWKPVTVQRLKRSVDLTVGLGLDVRIKGSWSVSADWRLFLPNPLTTLPAYAEFALPMYEEALKGGQLWFGAAYCW
jgi:hypothetical protein